MNKNVTLFGILLLSTFFMVGCMDVQVIPKANLAGLQVGEADGEALGAVNVNNWGFFFCNWPIVTGDCSDSRIIWFEDDTEVEDLMKVLTGKSIQMGGNKVYNTYSQITNQGLLFFVRTVNLSGTVVR